MSLFNIYLLANWLPTEMRAWLSDRDGILVGTVLQFGGLTGTIFAWLAGQDRRETSPLRPAYFIGAICVSCIALVGHNQTLVILAVLGTGFGNPGGQNRRQRLGGDFLPDGIRSTGGRLGNRLRPHRFDSRARSAGVLLQLDNFGAEYLPSAVFPALIASAAAAGMGRVRHPSPWEGSNDMNDSSKPQARARHTNIASRTKIWRGFAQDFEAMREVRLIEGCRSSSGNQRARRNPSPCASPAKSRRFCSTRSRASPRVSAFFRAGQTPSVRLAHV